MIQTKLFSNPYLAKFLDTLEKPFFHVEHSSMMSNAAKSFDVLTTSLSVLHNYFDNSTKIIFSFI